MNGADFNPPRLLRNPHVQSVLASSGMRRLLSLRRGAEIESRAEEHILDCGEGIRLQGFHTAQRRSMRGAWAFSATRCTSSRAGRPATRTSISDAVRKPGLVATTRCSPGRASTA